MLMVFYINLADMLQSLIRTASLIHVVLMRYHKIFENVLVSNYNICESTTYFLWRNKTCFRITVNSRYLDFGYLE